jgi:hypothetical protein
MEKIAAIWKFERGSSQKKKKKKGLREIINGVKL